MTGGQTCAFDGTTLTLRGTRRTLNSAVFYFEDYTSTNIAVGVRQRLLQRIFLGLNVGYENCGLLQHPGGYRFYSA